MNAYRLSGTVAADRTITVRVPEATAGEEADVIVLFPERALPSVPATRRTLAEFFKLLESSPPQKSTADEEQAFLLQLRDEWH